MPSTPAILAAAHAVMTALSAPAKGRKAAQFTGVELTGQTFRLEGTRDGKRLVVQAAFAAERGSVAVIIDQQAGRGLKTSKGVGTDHTVACIAAIA